MEALLFGVSGFLTEANDQYGLSLKNEFSFLSKKYNLESMDVNTWKFLRMRPNAFPTIRIAQLAKLIFINKRLFSSLLFAENLKDIKDKYKVGVSDYWLYNYHFKKKSIFLSKNIGDQFLNTIIINTLVP